MRGAKLLGNANNGDNAGSVYLNGNNAPSDANANWGAFLNDTCKKYDKGVSLTHWSKIAEMAASLVAHEGERHTCREVFADSHISTLRPTLRPHRDPFLNQKTPECMRRIRDNRENESLENAYKAYDNFSDQKHSRDYVQVFDADLQRNLEEIVRQIADESWKPKGYKKKIIFEKKKRQLAKAPIEDHVLESATILPYEKSIYDYSTWRAPAVKPGMGTHGLFRFLRNELYAWSQEDMMYYVPMDAHHYFPLMDHAILKDALARLVKPGKLLTFFYKVVDSYLQGVPLGIKVAQLFGQIYLARFDRLAMRFFDIGKDPEKLAYWTQRYVTDRICTARTEADYRDLCRGPGYLARKFQSYVEEGVPFYLRFVDNILIRHADKTALHIILELAIMHLARDWHVTVNTDYNVRPIWMGIRLAGYVFYHDHVAASKRNKQELAKRVRRLQKLGFDEEQIRIKLASRFGFIKHADCINLIKSLGMEKSLGKIIKKRRVRPPFQGMNPEQKVPFSSVVNKCKGMLTGGVNQPPTKLFLEDYVIQDSKIEKQVVSVSMSDSAGQIQDIPKQVPGKVLAIRFKKIIQTFTTTDFNGEEQETYQFEKKRDEKGQPTTQDAEFYTFTGSKIMIDQAMSDFSREDLPVPTVIQQFRGKDGKEYTKFT